MNPHQMQLKCEKARIFFRAFKTWNNRHGVYVQGVHVQILHDDYFMFYIFKAKSLETKDLNKGDSSIPLFHSNKSIKRKLIRVTNQNRGKYMNYKRGTIETLNYTKSPYYVDIDYLKQLPYSWLGTGLFKKEIVVCIWFYGLPNLI